MNHDANNLDRGSSSNKTLLQIDKKVSPKAAVVSLFCFAVLRVKGPEKRKQGPLDKTERVCRPIELCRQKIIPIFIQYLIKTILRLYLLLAYTQWLTNTSMEIATVSCLIQCNVLKVFHFKISRVKNDLPPATSWLADSHIKRQTNKWSSVSRILKERIQNWGFDILGNEWFCLTSLSILLVRQSFRVFNKKIVKKRKWTDSERDPDQNRRELGGPGEPEVRAGPASSLLKGCPAFRNPCSSGESILKVINSTVDA